jgi:cysteine synthase
MLPRAKDIESALWRATRLADRLAAMEAPLTVPHEQSAASSASGLAGALTDALVSRRQEQWVWDVLERLDRETVEVTSEAAQVMGQWMRSLLKREAEGLEESCGEALQAAERLRRETEARIVALNLSIPSGMALEWIPGTQP